MRTAVVFFATLFLGTQALGEETYRVTVKRVGQDLYEVVGQGLIIKTRYCYEYTYGDDAILIIESMSGFNIGRLIFIGGTSTECDVEKILG